MTMSNQIFSEVTNILMDANKMSNYKDAVDILMEAPIVTVLIPLLVTHLSPLVALNAKVYRFVINRAARCPVEGKGAFCARKSH